MEKEKKEFLDTTDVQDTKPYEHFTKCQTYLEKNNFTQFAQKALKYYIGEQWGAVAKGTENIPRAVFNICKYQINNKVANITSTPVSLKFFSNNSTQDTATVTHFAKYLLKEMHHERYREKITKDALIKGTGVQHMYYDTNANGTYGDFVGAIREEILSFDNVAVDNASCLDIQAQKRIIIRSRKTIGALKKMCKDPKERMKIVPDSKPSDEIMLNMERYDSELVNTYLEYYRKDGEVYHTLATSKAYIYKDIPLNPKLHKVEKVKNEDGTDEEWIEMPTGELEDNSIEKYSKIKFYRYPINFLVLNDSDDSIYGISELKDVIATQKYINQLYSMQLLNVINTAWDKYVVSPDALRNQVINDKSGQVIIDYSRAGNGIKRLGGMSAMANGVITMANDIFSLHRTINQITDLYTGETANKDIAASALSQLNSQADKPMDVLRKKLWSYEEEVGKTLELFMKLYYDEVTFSYEMSEAEQIIAGEGAGMYAEETFNGNELANVPFHIVVEAMQGTRDSEMIQENLAQSLFLNGTLSNASFHDKQLYIEFSPLVEPMKDKLKALLKMQAQDEISQLQQANAQLMQQNQQLANTLERANQGIKYMANVNKQMNTQYQNEIAAHQKDVKVRDNAVEKILSNDSEGNVNKNKV